MQCNDYWVWRTALQNAGVAFKMFYKVKIQIITDNFNAIQLNLMGRTALKQGCVNYSLFGTEMQTYNNWME